MLEITIKDTEKGTINTYEAEGIIFAACDDGDGTNLITGKLSPFVAAELLYNLQRNLRKCFQQETNNGIDVFTLALKYFSKYLDEEGNDQWN